MRKRWNNKNIGISFSRNDVERYGVKICEIEEDSREIFPGITIHRNFERITDYEQEILIFL